MENKTDIQTNVDIDLSNDDLKQRWSGIYKKITDEVYWKKDGSLTKEQIKIKSETPLEERVRTLLKNELGPELIKNDPIYGTFFKQALRIAINLDVDNMSRKIEGGRIRYGETRHAKGRINPSNDLLDEEI